MRTTIIAVIVVVVLIALGLWFNANNQPEIQPLPEPLDATLSELPTGESNGVKLDGSADLEVTTENIGNHTITYSGSSFSLSSLEAKIGDTVTFVNNGSASLRVASNPHPVHSDHPEFDSGTLAPGSSWAFTFSKTGTYGFHNHLNPGAAGQITVR
ncbi:MAG: hypothetical protein COV10_04505 [Candidatus Vogelbacteria bacterium CG10_big_fil_rev_8_21_14_0_10_51_16]|uniref:EfeO-type cupredoxin-like domain-containing protein n=1 Tax=Candidatus Vogelbacteria bacterium CG10_big_fil_rev_8_21_14_0_10_51_16 TaxID=1975045 RepID=A0A2H0RDD1_9BACT|nr:MAG: hypothetical protein COV10_04505 [Candidatus Vogelbacteria bacterium CG10_big_fil_rev_8_21_14_0_10_51_16]